MWFNRHSWLRKALGEMTRIHPAALHPIFPPALTLLELTPCPTPSPSTKQQLWVYDMWEPGARKCGKEEKLQGRDASKALGNGSALLKIKVNVTVVMENAGGGGGQ